jgi:RNA polymerase sigma factor (sigma-70 family)
MRARPRFATDDRLVGLVRRGDLTAFEILYGRHARELLNFCNSILGSRHDAEDAVQSTFASAYRALIADERPVELRPWLFAIARNASLSILRTRKPTAELHEHAPAREDPAAQAEQRESLRQVVATMLELPERQRTALVLAELHGLSQGEIGTVLGVPAEKVKSYIFQARTNLISERGARSADCREIREELVAARGAGLLKSRLRRHMRTCEGCRDYAQQLSAQRGQLGMLFPLAPTLALKRRVLDAATSANAAGAGSVGGAAVGASLAGTSIELAGGGVKALVAKLLIGAVGVGAGTGAGTAVLAAATTSSRHPAAHQRQTAAAGVTPRSAVEGPGLAAQVDPQRAGSSDLSAPGAAGVAPAAHERKAASARAEGAPGSGAGGQSATAQEHGKSTEAHGHGAKANEAPTGSGKSVQAHGKSGETHGKSAQAPGHAQGHGNGLSHGKSQAAHGQGAARATGPQGQAVAHGNAPAVTGNGHGHANGPPAPGATPGAASPSGNANAGGNGNGAAPAATPSPASEAAHAGAPANANAGGNGNGAGTSNPQSPGEPPAASHEAPEHPQKH